MKDETTAAAALHSTSAPKLVFSSFLRDLIAKGTDCNFFCMFGEKL